MTREPRTSPCPEAAHLAGASAPVLSAADQALEDQIEATRQAFLAAKTRSMRLELQETMRQLIGLRSPWVIAQMERERGLR